ncbi:phage tail tube protein [Sagittula sp. MA-2]|jgi:hypothetical protein|uniref:phage tail tube protein n=1 Tax=Sagittula sp. MA-2 TaxID=3048007 RepID=UPI0024C3139B|nr:phage tail tube protein [Sagittula sp. MA-2]WHZ35757.1 phage tail tube protein [Sagittula sp. MA-2]
MAIAQTADFDEYVLEVEFTAGSGTFAKVCGLTDFSVSRTNDTGSSMVPDCADESLPYYIKRAVTSQDISISATGVWALANHADMRDWWGAGSTLNVRVTNAAVTASGTAGDPEVETIPMILTALNNARTKGQVVTAEIELQQNGAATVTDIPA